MSAGRLPSQHVRDIRHLPPSAASGRNAAGVQRGLLGLFLAAFTTLLRALLGFDSTPRELVLSFLAALFVIGFVAPGFSELVGLGQEGAAMCGAILGIAARPLIEALMQLARALRDDAPGILRA